MPKHILSTPSAPKPIGPYSVAVESGGLVFLSGQVGANPATGERAPDEIEAQTRQVMENIGSVLEDLGLGYSDITKTTVFLKDMADYPLVNEIYGGYFSEEPPARSAVQVAALPGGYLIEIEVIASR